ncbi:MAG TPA: DegV family protein [Anaerolineae bacterium]
MTHDKTALITDSTCDIPDDLLARYEIDFVPCSIAWGSDVLRDRIDIGAAEFYRRLASDPVYPKTAAPSPEQFRLAYAAAQARGAREILVVTVSSAMSGTYRAALLGAEQAPIPVTVLDARGPTMSVGWQVLAAARAREAGGDLPAMIAAAEHARSGMAQWVSLDTLEYLHKGGRIGNATRLVGTLLSIKPLVYIDHETGLVESGPLVRTRRKSLDMLYQSFFTQLGERRPARVAVLHGGAEEEARELAERIRREQAPCELILTTTSPVLGVHTGPAAVALCGYSDAV